MKITMLFGSPHKQGTTNVLAEAFMKGAQEAGHEVTRLNLAQMKIGGCMACDYCSRTKQGCIQKDDMQQVEPAVEQAQLIVLATPLYYYGMSAQLKAAIDRFYSFSGPLREKKVVLLAACADGEGAMDALLAHYEDFKPLPALGGRGQSTGIQLLGKRRFGKNRLSRSGV